MVDLPKNVKPRPKLDVGVKELLSFQALRILLQSDVEKILTSPELIVPGAKKLPSIGSEEVFDLFAVLFG